MSELRDLLDREARQIQGGDESLSWVMRRVHRRRRSRRAATGAVALMIAAVGAFGTFRAFSPRPDDRRVGQTTPEEGFEGIWPETGLDKLKDAQRSIDEGHQPWRTDPNETARAFATNVMQWQYDQVEVKILGSDDPRAILVQLVNRDRPSDADLPDSDLATLVTLKQLGREGVQGIWSVIAVEGFVQVSWPEEDAVLVPGDPFEIGGTVSYFPAGATVEAGLFAGDGGVPFVGEGSLAVRRIEGTENGFFGELGRVPDDPDGSIILVALARDGNGSIIGAAARRVRVATSGGARQVLVFFSFDPNDPAVVRAVPRLIPTTANPLEGALRELLRGPTDEERAQGLSSPFSSDTVDFLNFARVENGVAIVDFANFWLRVAKVSAIDGHVRLESQLDATVFQFPEIDGVVYQFDGKCEAFPHLAHAKPCTKIERPIPYQPTLTPEVAMKRDAIIHAAANRNHEALRRLIDADNFTFSYGGGRDPVAFWNDLEGQGQDPLPILVELLSMPYIRIGDTAIFVWPSFFTSDPNHFTEAELRLARRIASEEEIQAWKEYGSYLGYRVGIEPDGDWIFFVAGD